ncbi:hypothetical protein [Paractinoplanes lichenicola]|uniref:hypothetical protein n=1 Tax=Paractinoplanes lichenicola TaxID=2802976 RepID=UPI0027DC3951|nr:hypothetical protein [Actinoplanes lichenicola]
MLLPAAAAPAVSPTARSSAPTFNGGVYAIAHRGATTYVGGTFTTATANGRTYPRERLAAFDSRTGKLLDWSPSADGVVRALAATDDSVYAAGDFHAVSGERRDSLVRIHPTNGAVRSFRHTLSGTPYALAAGNGRLYLGGSFTQVTGERRDNLAAFSLTTGRLDPRWRPVADDTVHAIAVTGPRVYLGGGFHLVGAVKGTLRLASVNGTSGVVDPAFKPRVPAEVRAIALDPTGVHVATAGRGGRAIAYSYAGALRWQRVFDGDAAAIATAGGITYVGGHFDNACLTERNGVKGGCVDGARPRFKLAAVTAKGQLASWGPKANGVIGVRVLSVNHVAGTIEAGGDFTMIDGADRRRFAAF